MENSKRDFTSSNSCISIRNIEKGGCQHGWIWCSNVIRTQFLFIYQSSCPCFCFILRLINMTTEAIGFSHCGGKGNESSSHMLPDCMSVGKRSHFHNICRKIPLPRATSHWGVHLETNHGSNQSNRICGWV